MTDKQFSDRWRRVVNRTGPEDLAAVAGLADAQRETEELRDSHPDWARAIERPANAMNARRLRILLRLIARRGVEPPEGQTEAFAAMLAEGWYLADGDGTKPTRNQGGYRIARK